jgi:hypothetical protein
VNSVPVYIRQTVEPLILKGYWSAASVRKGPNPITGVFRAGPPGCASVHGMGLESVHHGKLDFTIPRCLSLPNLRL